MRCLLATLQVHAGSMLSLLPVSVGRLCSHFHPRSRALLARMTFRTRWCATTALTARTAVTRASVTSHRVTRSHSLTVATGRYVVHLCLPGSLSLCSSTHLSFWVSVSLFVRLSAYLLSACLQLSVRLHNCLSVCESACLLLCLQSICFICLSQIENMLNIFCCV